MTRPADEIESQHLSLEPAREAAGAEVRPKIESEDMADELAGLRILAAAWRHVPVEARVAAIQAVVDNPANLGDATKPRRGWMEDVFRAIDTNEVAGAVEREECARIAEEKGKNAWALDLDVENVADALAAEIAAAIRARGPTPEAAKPLRRYVPDYPPKRENSTPPVATHSVRSLTTKDDAK